MEAHTPAALRFLHQPDLGLLLLRVALGISGVFHGGQKLFSAFGGKGMEGFTKFLGSMNVPMPGVSAYMAALAEFGGGILIAIGLFTRLASIPFAFTMLVAWGMAHQFSFIKTETVNGSELPFHLMVMALALVFTGPGKYSVQALFFGKRDAAPHRV
ncbi:MAG TPA: DoxX family protein [Phycisphaerales bacterium]|nr:DoxX family protein [Phycisphaerales bacterium]